MTSDLDGHYGCLADHSEEALPDGPNGPYAQHLRQFHQKCGAYVNFIGRDCYCGEPLGHEGEHYHTRSGLPLQDMGTQALADGTDWRSRAARGEPY